MSALTKENYEYDRLYGAQARNRSAAGEVRRRSNTRIRDVYGTRQERPGTRAHYEQVKNVPERSYARQQQKSTYHDGGRKLAYAGNVDAAALKAPMVDMHVASAQKKRAAKNIVAVIFAFAILSVIISRYAIISSNNLANYQLNKNIDTIKTDIQDLSLSVSLKDDLENIKNVAQNDLGMGFPDGNQTRYIEFKEKSSASPAKTQTSEVKSDTWVNVVTGWFNTIKNLFE